jgi:hypothetical protein
VSTPTIVIEMVYKQMSFFTHVTALFLTAIPVTAFFNATYVLFYVVFGVGQHIL